jgi:curli biogenesis system outer membrane secretion channel CsgG
MAHEPSRHRPCLTAAVLLAASMIYSPTRASADSEPVIETTKSSSALRALGAKPLEQRLPVTIYEFHGGSPNVSVAAATDMFTTALVESGQFRVVERQRLSQDLMAEKQMNAAGQTSGDTDQKQLRGARYIFEGTVTEANPQEDQKQGGINIGGLNLGAGKTQDTLAIDVRIVDVDTGDVLDSIKISKVLNDSNSGVSGTGAFVSTLAAMRGRSANPLTPDVNYQTAHKESVDKALRACIDTSVLALIKRLEPAASAAAAR